MYIEFFFCLVSRSYLTGYKVFEYYTSIHRNISPNFSTLCLSVSIQKIASAGCKLELALLLWPIFAAVVDVLFWMNVSVMMKMCKINHFPTANAV